jgi:hypothetical protein
MAEVFMHAKNHLKLILLILSLLILNLPDAGGLFTAQATVRYVSHTGSSTPPYTSWTTASDSIQKCIDICVFGDTIYVANGVYKERIEMIPGLALIGTGMDSCIIDSREFNYVSGFYTVKIADICFIEGFNIITYDATHGFGIYIREESGMTINSKIISNKFQEAVTGIRFSGYATTNSQTFIYKNWIQNVEDGISCQLNKPIISENIIYPKENGLVSQINAAPTYLNNIIVFDNEIGITGFSGTNDLISILKDNLLYVGGGIAMYSYDDSLINNIAFGREENGGLGYFGSGSELRNDHIEKMSVGLEYDTWIAPPPVYQYNNMWDNDVNFQNFSPDTTNIFVNPMFVNTDSMDFHLQKYSPLINAGDPNILDKDGTRSDIGIYGGPFGESYVYLDLPPRPPVNLTAEVDSSVIMFTWNRNTEADFNHYNLYCDTTKNFQIDSTKLVASLPDTVYLYIIPQNAESLYFKLTAVDNNGNESNPSEEVEIIITSINDYPMTINNYTLYQNYPNPFNPSTKIGYRLKERGYVKLYVYDIKGELVSLLVNQTQEAGYYEVEFFAGDRSQKSEVSGHSGLSGIKGLASGIYIYQVIVRNERDIPVFTDIKKMVYVK